jgi:hypothetical protein
VDALVLLGSSSEHEAINGIRIIDAAALRQAGGFTELDGWRTSYIDYLLLAARLTEQGGRISHCPPTDRVSSQGVSRDE